MRICFFYFGATCFILAVICFILFSSIFDKHNVLFSTKKQDKALILGLLFFIASVVFTLLSIFS